MNEYENPKAYLTRLSLHFTVTLSQVSVFWGFRFFISKLKRLDNMTFGVPPGFINFSQLDG